MSDQNTETGRMVVLRPFNLTLEHGKVKHFEAGLHEDVPREVIDHWYVKSHISPDGKMPAGGFTNTSDGARIRQIQEEADLKVKSAEEVSERLQDELAQARQRHQRLADEHAATATEGFTLKADAEKLRGEVARLTGENKKLHEDAGLASRELEMLRARVEELESDEEPERPQSQAKKTGK